jgi:hypothetical protein
VFDPAKSDPAALAQVDAGMAALGGSVEKWNAVKELRFHVALKIEGKPVARFEHSWDRWNGRHALRTADMRTAGNREDDIKWHDVRYDIFNEGAIFWVSYAKQEALRADYARAASEARVRLAEDTYRISFPYRLRDPGAHVALGDNVAPTAGACEPSCVEVKLTFDPEVGGDKWFIYYNKNTNVPELFAQETAKGRLNYRVAAWADAGGMKWPSQLVNIGNAGEVFEFSAIEIGEPRESAYSRDL